MAKREERKAVMFTPEEMKWLKALSDANTSGNESELLRSLLRKAVVNPSLFGMMRPQDFRPALNPRMP